ncbi:MAG: nicotinate (nicotinamide) nucleotide adenylyltransferase [Oscillospiraceae bacterium]|nr:nicotinate (nicotinamide) nucleotide adenylyltransferase [Oscillospiraceae bacterium]
MKLGILGGTFNPIHNSHLYLAREFARRLELDKVLLVPVYTPPHKDSAELAPPSDRLNMCRLAAEGCDLLDVSDWEISRQEKSYTYLTLGHLRREYPGAGLYLLMGADMFLTVQSWRCPESIFGDAVLCAAAREHEQYSKLTAHREVLENLGARSTVLEIPPKPLSSTAVRSAAAQNKSLSEMVPYTVEQYIRLHGLYGLSAVYEKTLTEMLSEKRLAHSRNVRDRAVHLARIHGADESKAALAGLLHDIYRDAENNAQLKYLSECGIILDDAALKHPAVWHGICGAEFVKRHFKITDDDIISAIRYHTTGRANMTELEKIIYLADGTSIDRKYKEAENYRALADESLDEAMYVFLKWGIKNYSGTKDTLEAYNYFDTKRKGN